MLQGRCIIRRFGGIQAEEAPPFPDDGWDTAETSNNTTSLQHFAFLSQLSTLYAAPGNLAYFSSVQV